jgi:hypothetical protein
MAVRYYRAVPDEPHHPAAQRWAFILTLWAERAPAGEPQWRGSLESVDGQRRYFHSLAELNCLLRSASGWGETQGSVETGG